MPVYEKSLAGMTTVMLVSTVSTRDCDSCRMGSNPIHYPKQQARLVQRYERLPYKQDVGGSTPSSRTTYKRSAWRSIKA